MKNIKKMHSFIALIPYIGFLIVFFWNIVEIYRLTRRKIYVVRYYFLFLIPAIIFSLLFFTIIYFWVINIVNDIYRLIILLLLCYLLLVCLGISSIIIKDDLLSR